MPAEQFEAGLGDFNECPIFDACPPGYTSESSTDSNGCPHITCKKPITYEEIGSGVCHDGVPGKSYDNSDDGKWPDAISNPYVGQDWRTGCTRINGKLLCFWRSKVDTFEQCVNFCKLLDNCKSFSINPNMWCAPHSETCAVEDLISHSTMVAYNMMPAGIPEQFEAALGDFNDCPIFDACPPG